jgi:hypothetical protein
MSLIEISRPIEGVVGPLNYPGVPSAGTSEVQTLTLGGTPSGGSFRLAFEGLSTGPIAWSGTNATLIAHIDAALEALPNIGSGGVNVAVGTMTAGVGTATITFAGNLAKLAVSTLTVASNALTGTSPTVAVAKTTPGVTATFRGASVGAVVTSTSNGKLYINSGTALAPVWTVVGSQS